MLVFTPDTPLLATLRALSSDSRPRLFCLTAVSTQFPLIRTIAEAIKQIDSTIYVALGGAYASLMPDEAIACPFIDAYVWGKGIPRWWNCGADPVGPPAHHDPQFWFKQPGTEWWRRTIPPPFSPTWTGCRLLTGNFGGHGFRNRKGPLSVGRTRLSLRCSYCSNHILGKLAKGSYVRFRSIIILSRRLNK